MYRMPKYVLLSCYDFSLLIIVLVLYCASRFVGSPVVGGDLPLILQVA